MLSDCTFNFSFSVSHSLYRSNISFKFLNGIDSSSINLSPSLYIYPSILSFSSSLYACFSLKVPMLSEHIALLWWKLSVASCIQEAGQGETHTVRLCVCVCENIECTDRLHVWVWTNREQEHECMRSASVELRIKGEMSAVFCVLKVQIQSPKRHECQCMCVCKSSTFSPSPWQDLHCGTLWKSACRKPLLFITLL